MSEQEAKIRASRLDRIRSVEVGRYPSNPWNLHDMHGNVSEWCWDAYAPYPTEDSIDPTGPESGPDRVCRGGSFSDTEANCRAAVRNRAPAGHVAPNIGFRVAIVPKKETR